MRTARNRGLHHGARQARGREPGISSWITRSVLRELESRGVPADELLEKSGLLREELEDPDAWIPQRCHAEFYRDAIAASGDPAFAVSVGRHLPIQVTRVAGHCAALSKDVREAMETWGRFSDLVVDETRFGVRSTPGFDAVYWTRLPALLPLHDDGPSFAVSVLSFLAQAVGPVKPLEVLLTGPAPASPALLAKALGAPVRFGAEHFELRLPPGTLDMPLHHADPAFRATLVAAAERELAMREGMGVADRVRAAILHVGFDRSARTGVVAEALGASARTLQRWLSEEGLTFSGIRGQALRDAAIEMLGEPGASVPDVAFRLGFSSRRAFHRAIRRWTGKTPVELAGRRARRSRRRPAAARS